MILYKIDYKQYTDNADQADLHGKESMLICLICIIHVP